MEVKRKMVERKIKGNILVMNTASDPSAILPRSVAEQSVLLLLKCYMVYTSILRLAAGRYINYMSEVCPDGFGAVNLARIDFKTLYDINVSHQKEKSQISYEMRIRYLAFLSGKISIKL